MSGYSINPFQREQIITLFNATFGPERAAHWEIVAFVNALDDVLEFTPKNSEQVYIYKTAKEFEFVLKNFFQTGRKIQAIKFVRQVHNPTPSLRDAKDIVDHFWNKFRQENVVTFPPNAIDL